MAQYNDITVYKGENVKLTFTMSPTTDITGWSIELTVRVNPTDSAAVFQQAAVLQAPYANGVFVITLTHAQLLLAAGTYAYDVQRIDAGAEAVLSIGRFIVKQEVLYP